GLWSPVVLKMARPHQVRHPRAVQTLCHETAALAGNLHPGLPRLLADGTSDPVPHIMIEYIDGPALDEEIAENGAMGDILVALGDAAGEFRPWPAWLDRYAAVSEPVL
ncbi:MAG: eukaryotic-like serine/threonine-protein kinase, partial [Kribbellaceae bacterium]|nr:eukaryotic-like serine/threonine-protein kinase [Kribbellaceae bacterium]